MKKQGNKIQTFQKNTIKNNNNKKQKTMDICKEGYLNEFVKPQSEGGWGLCEWIVSVMTENRSYSRADIYAAIQGSTLDASIKALTEVQIGLIQEYMVGKTFSGVLIGNATNQQITYVLPE